MMMMTRSFRNGVLISVFYLLTLSFIRCTFREPSAPVWDVEWIIPLIDRIWTMEELTDEVDELSVDPATDQIILTYEEELDLSFENSLLRIDMEKREPLTAAYAMNSRTVDSLQIHTAGYPLRDPVVIKQGRLRLVFRNDHPDQSIRIGVRLLDLYQPDGVTQPEFDVEIPPSSEDGSDGVQRLTIDLENYILHARNRYLDNYLRFQVQPAGSDPGNYGHFGMFLRDEIVLESLSGRIDGLEAWFDKIEIDEPVPEQLKDLRIQTMRLQVPFEYHLPAPLDLFLSIEAVNPRKGSAEPIQVSQSYTPGPGGAAVQDTIVFEDVSGFINSNPEKIEIGGFVRIGDGTQDITITSDDVIFTSVIFKAPLIVELPIDTTTTSVDTLEIEEDTRDLIRDNVNRMALTADIENYTPLSARIHLFFSKSIGDSTLYQHPADLEIGPIVLPPAALSGDPAVVTAAGVETWDEVLTDDDKSLFAENDKVYMGTRIIYTGSAARLAKFRPLDYIRVSANLNANLSTLIPEEDEEEGAE